MTIKNIIGGLIMKKYLIIGWGVGVSLITIILYLLKIVDLQLVIGTVLASSIPCILAFFY